MPPQFGKEILSGESICTTKTLISVIFNWVKQCIIGQEFLNQNTSNGLTYKKHPKSRTHDSPSTKIWQIL